MTEPNRSADVLSDLMRALPVPTLLVDDAGAVIWLNDEAVARFATDGDEPRGGDVPPTPEEVAAWVAREVGLPRQRSVRLRPSWTAPGEEVVVAAAGGASNRAVICVHPARYATRPHATTGNDLSCREAEVAGYAARGFTVLNIAAVLGIAESTVKTHLKRIYRKLDVTSRVELARRLSTDR